MKKVLIIFLFCGLAFAQNEVLESANALEGALTGTFGEGLASIQTLYIPSYGLVITIDDLTGDMQPEDASAQIQSLVTPLAPTVKLPAEQVIAVNYSGNRDYSTKYYLVLIYKPSTQSYESYLDGVTF